jgi:hypothetical protein
MDPVVPFVPVTRVSLGFQVSQQIQMVLGYLMILLLPLVLQVLLALALPDLLEIQEIQDYPEDRVAQLALTRRYFLSHLLVHRMWVPAVPYPL